MGWSERDSGGGGGGGGAAAAGRRRSTDASRRPWEVVAVVVAVVVARGGWVWHRLGIDALHGCHLAPLVGLLVEPGPHGGKVGLVL